MFLTDNRFDAFYLEGLSPKPGNQVVISPTDDILLCVGVSVYNVLPVYMMYKSDNVCMNQTTMIEGRHVITL